MTKVISKIAVKVCIYVCFLPTITVANAAILHSNDDIAYTVDTN